MDYTIKEKPGVLWAPGFHNLTVINYRILAANSAIQDRSPFNKRKCAHPC